MTLNFFMTLELLYYYEKCIKWYYNIMEYASGRQTNS